MPVLYAGSVTQAPYPASGTGRRKPRVNAAVFWLAPGSVATVATVAVAIATERKTAFPYLIE